MKPKYVYHGSGRELVGDMLLPKRAEDLGSVKDNSLIGVYASDLREQAISMAIHSCKGVGCGSLCFRNVNGKKVMESIIYDGWPEQDHIYLYILPSDTFENRPRGSHQWVSLTPVKPAKLEKLLVKDYIHLVRKATEKEKKEFFEKHKDTLDIKRESNL